MITVGEIDRRIGRAVASLAGIIRRGIFSKVGDDGFGQVEAYDGEAFSAVQIWQHFGFASRPVSGVEVLIAKVGNRGESAIGIADSDAGRPGDLEPGEAAIYSEGEERATVRCKPNGEIHLNGNSEQAIKGTTFNGDMATMMTLIQSAFTALAAEAMIPTSAAANTAAANAIGDFLTAQPGHLSEKVKID